MNKIKIILIVLIGGFQMHFIQAQIGGPTFNQVVEQAESELFSEDYYSALRHFEDALKYGKEETRLHYQAAEAAWKLHAIKSALEHYQAVYQAEDADQYEDITYRLGILYQKEGKYEEAKYNLGLYVSESDADSLKVEDARRRIKSCNWAAQSKPDTMVTLDHLGQDVNTPYSDFSAHDLGDTLYYASLIGKKTKDRYHPPRKISRIMQHSDSLGTREMPGDINAAEVHSANISFGPDNRFAYYTVCDYVQGGKLRCNIYYRRIIEPGKWSAAIALPNNINVPRYTSTHPMMAFDSVRRKKVLYFVSDRPGGKGKMDLWYAIAKGENSYEEPINISDLNTSGDEYSPFYLNSENLLYFSSNGQEEGFGGIDIYKSKSNTPGKFEKPENLLAPINSSYDDVYFSMSKDESYAYLSSNRLGSLHYDELLEACCYDIYKAYFIPPPIVLNVLAWDDFDTSAVKGVTIALRNLTDNTHDLLLTADTSNRLTYEIEHAKQYEIVVSKDGYLSDTLHLDTRDMRKIRSLDLSAYLTKLVPLTATVWDDNTEEPLSNAHVRLFEMIDGQKVLLKDERNPSGNDYHYQLIRGHSYLLWGTKEKYDQATVAIHADETAKGTPIEKKIGLVRTAIRMLEKVLPLVLYFENDQPEPKTKLTTTKKRYRDLFNPFYANKATYKKEYSGIYGPMTRPSKEAEIDDFFENELKANYKKLDLFMEQVLGVLEGGLLLEVTIKGYTSPIAKSDYNYRLSKRRVQCLKNEFYDWKNGLLVQYINSGLLVLEEAPFGESKVATGVSDSPFDKRNSVYSPAASKERRVEIIAVKRLAKAKKGFKRE